MDADVIGLPLADFLLAGAHHLLIFALAGVLAFEIGVIRAGMSAAEVRRVARVDLFYGLLAAAILVVGFTRANVAAKGWDYYAHNTFFWLKIACFALVGVLSIAPTFAIQRWRRTLATVSAAGPDPADVNMVRKFLFAEAVAFAFIPLFAAAMARGYGV